MKPHVLPLPPSANAYWRSIVVKGQVRVLLSAEARKYKERAAIFALTQRMEKHEQGEVAVAGTVYFARRGCDLDNRIKPLLDALKGIAWTDDRQVARLVFERSLDPKNPRVELYVKHYPESE